MAANLEGATLAVADPRAPTAQLIRQCEPPLCLQGWPNPQARDIKRLRDLGRDEAKRAILG
ncbi:MAG: hypothetical protein OXC91_06610 [Rhodobacteraceae bacterium]|nr:hypothetical protein [Paracoccaceae bacterium]